MADEERLWYATVIFFCLFFWTVIGSWVNSGKVLDKKMQSFLSQLVPVVEGEWGHMDTGGSWQGLPLLSWARVSRFCTGQPVHSFMIVSQVFPRPSCVSWRILFHKVLCRITWPNQTRWCRTWQPCFVQSYWFYIICTRSGAGTSSPMPRFSSPYRRQGSCLTSAPQDRYHEGLEQIVIRSKAAILGAIPST